MDKKLQDSLSKIKLLICDIDGVLTDGSFIKSTSGDELRSFNALDGVGFVMLRLLNLNIKTAWITGRESLTTTQRAEELQIDDVYNGVIRKIDAYDELKKKYGVSDSEVCFIGDDIIDMNVYWQGCLWGGKIPYVFDMMRQIDQWTKEDIPRDSVGQYYEESYLNKFFLTHRNEVHTLMPDYAYPEMFKQHCNFPNKMMHLAKDNKSLNNFQW